jgi:lipid-A-disaccharide synthase
VWAWGRGRIVQLAHLVDRLVVILPFEKDFFKQYGIQADYVGHPLVESAKPTLTKERFMKQFQLNPDQPLIGLLPGSRRQEVKKILPVMLKTCALVNKQKNIQVLIAASPNVDTSIFNQVIKRNIPPAVLCPGLPYDVMSHTDLVVTASGSATLETAYLGTPMVIVYRVAPLTWLLGKWLVKLPYIGLVNVVAGEKIVPEYLQHDMQPPQIAAHLLQLLADREQYNAMVQQLDQVKHSLGTGSPSQRAAALVQEMLK